MNKLLMLSIFSILMILILNVNMVSAFEFDNVKAYDPITKEITIKNSFLGIPTGDIAKIKLNTPLVYYVIPGENRKVAEYTINLYDIEYIQPIKELELYDGTKKITRPITYKYKTYEEYNVDDFKEICKDTGEIEKNGTAIMDCTYEKIGTHKATKEVWNNLDISKLTKGEVTIGIFTEVKPGDYIEWVPNIMGVKINEWAVWSDSLSNGLKFYWRLNETSGTTAYDALGVSNFTINNVNQWNATGKIGGCLKANGAGDNTGYNLQNAYTANGISFSFWTYQFANPVNYRMLWSNSNDATANNGEIHVHQGTAYDFRLFIHTTIGDELDLRADTTLNVWTYMTVVMNNATKNITVYKDSVPVASGVWTGNFAPPTDTLWLFSRGTSEPNNEMLIDEFAIWNRTLSTSEITDLYNEGNGITYSAGGSPLSVTTTLFSPVNYYNTSSTSVTFSANATAVMGNVTNMTLYLWNGITKTNSTIGLTGLTNTSSWTMAGLSDALYTWNTLSCAVNSTSSVCAFNTNRTLRVDTIGPTVNITYPVNSSTIVTFLNSTNVTINLKASDSGVGLSSCLISLDGVAPTPITCGTNTSNNFTEGYHNITYIGNDLLSNSANVTNTFFINYLRPLVSYSSAGVELEYSTFLFNITATSITQANATINYNNTNYVMDIGSYNETVGAFYKTILLPEVTANTVKQFNITYYVNGVQYNTSLYNQTVYNIPALNITAGLCSGTPVYWFSLQDEENLSTISGEFEYNFYYGLSNSSMVRTYGKISSANNFSICTNTTINPNWTIGSGEILYSSTGYVDRRYYIFDNTVVTSATNLTLYDLLSTSQTSFKLEVEDTSLNPYENIYTRLLRWYPDLNEYKIVDIGKTDETGSTVIHVRTEDVDYRIGAYYTNGSLIYLANPIRMICLASPCTYTLKISPGEVDYTSFLNIVYTFTYNETTGIWDFTYSDTTGKTSTMNLTVYRVTSTSIYPVCSDTITGAVGALTCNTSFYTTGELRAEVYRSASPPVVIVQKVVHLFTTAFKGSNFGLWLSLLLGLPVVFLFALISPIGALLGGIIALIPALYFGSINIGVVGGLAILAGIVAHFLKRIS